MENEENLQNSEKEEQEFAQEEEGILSQVTGGSAVETATGLATASTFFAGVGALAGSNSNGLKGAGTGAAIGGGASLGVFGALAGGHKWLEARDAAKKAATKLK